MGMFSPEELNIKANIHVVTVPGAITNDTADLVAFQRMLEDSPLIKARDFTKMARPFDQDMFDRPNGDRPIRLGYLVSDSFFPACLTTQRAIREVVARLSQDPRFEMVDLSAQPPFQSRHLVRTFLGIMSAEGKLGNFFKMLKGDTIIKEYKLMVASSRVPGWLKPVVTRLLSWLGEERLAWVVGSTNALSYDQF